MEPLDSPSFWPSKFMLKIYTENNKIRFKRELKQFKCYLLDFKT